MDKVIVMPSWVVVLKRAISGSCAAPAASLSAAAAASSQTTRSATERFICSRAAIPRQPTPPVQNGGYLRISADQRRSRSVVGSGPLCDRIADSAPNQGALGFVWR